RACTTCSRHGGGWARPIGSSCCARSIARCPPPIPRAATCGPASARRSRGRWSPCRAVASGSASQRSAARRRGAAARGCAGAGVRVGGAGLIEGVPEDPLAAWMEKRRAFRGVFPRPAPELAQALRGLAARDTIVVTERDAIATLAREYDAANLRFLAQPAFEAELYAWLRLVPSHPGWDRDGLTAPCLALSPIEARAAHLLLRPAVLPWLRRTGLAGALMSEAAAIRSAAAVVLFAPLRSEDAFHVGRRFHRLWLDVTRGGAALCPFSSLADHEPTAREVERRFAIPAERRLANAFRVGVAPGEPAKSPRLPVGELIV